MKTSSISRRVAVIRCRRPTGCGRAAGQRDVDARRRPAALELGGLELRPCAPRSAPSSARRASLAARPTAPRSSGGSCGDAAQQVGQLGLAAEEAHAQRPRARPCRVAPATAASPCWRSSAMRSSMAADPTVELVEGDGRRHRRRSATPSGSGCARPRRRPPRPRPGSPSRSAPTTSVTSLAAAPASSGAPARATSAIRRPGSSATSRTRATGTSNIAPIEARTALGPYGSALPGPSATLPAPNASAERSDGADVAGVVDAPQRQAERAGGRRRPALAVDAERARARAELRDRREHVRRDRHAVQAAALGGVERLGRPAGARGRLDQVLALGDEQPQLVPPLAAGELADLLELFVVGAGDRHGLDTKKGAAPVGGAPVRWVLSLAD